MWGRVYEALSNPRPEDRVGRGVSLALLILIAANVVASVLETDAGLAQSAPGFFYWFELISVSVFTAEYVLRFMSCTTSPQFHGAIRGRIRFVFSPMALIDLVSIVPFFISLLLPGVVDLRFLRVLRLLRLFRLLRVGRPAEAFALLVRVVQSKRVELAVSMVVVLVAMLLAAGAIYVAENGQPGTQFTSIPRSMWWSIVTITTVGYGDMTPTTPIGQAIGGLVAFVGICALALPVGIVSSGYMQELSRKTNASIATDEACPHCGVARR
jgi:voltage-gated potassium channel